MKINSQHDFTSKTAKINHVRSNSKFQIKSIQHDFIFLSLIWFFLQTLILGLNFNVWQEINCQRKKIQIKNFTSDLKFPIKGSNSKFHITWNQIMTRKRGPHYVKIDWKTRRQPFITISVNSLEMKMVFSYSIVQNWQ